MITKHSKQRQPDHEIKEDQYLINWINIFNK